MPGKDPKTIGLSGLTLSVALPQGAAFRPKAVSVDFETRGFVGAYDGPEGKNPSCVGVVVWWGQSLADACSTCDGAEMQGNVCVKKKK